MILHGIPSAAWPPSFSAVQRRACLARDFGHHSALCPRALSFVLADRHSCFTHTPCRVTVILPRVRRSVSGGIIFPPTARRYLPGRLISWPVCWLLASIEERENPAFRRASWARVYAVWVFSVLLFTRRRLRCLSGKVDFVDDPGGSSGAERRATYTCKIQLALQTDWHASGQLVAPEQQPSQVGYVAQPRRYLPGQLVLAEVQSFQVG